MRWFRCRPPEHVCLRTSELLIEPFSFSLSQFWSSRCGMDTFIWGLFQGLTSVVGSMQLDPSLSAISGLAGNRGVRGLPVHVLWVTRRGKWKQAPTQILSLMPCFSLKNRQAYVWMCLPVHRPQEAPSGKNRAEGRASSCGEHSLEESSWLSRGEEVLISLLDTNRACLNMGFHLVK